MREPYLTLCRDRYRDDLLQDTLPFWLDHSMDSQYGGYFTALARNGDVIDTDKSVWFQARFAWFLLTLYADVERRPDWLAAAKSGIDFLRGSCFDSDGRMFFQVTRAGEPLRKRRYIFSEMFAIIAFAALARATDDEEAGCQARALFQHVRELLEANALLPKINPATRPCKGLAIPMIWIVTAQELRKATDDPYATEVIDQAIDEIERDFLSEEFHAVLETVGPDGQFLDHHDGRTINPGHTIEAAWFILEESRYRGGDGRLNRLGLRILDWSWQWGWDDEFGGIIYFRDVRNMPVPEYWHDMKFWWPQNEAIIATLMAYERTGDAKYLEWHQQAHEWAHQHFPDPEMGEWFGYLHRDGRVSSTAKGTMWKGPFHLPRMQLVCWQVCERLLGASG